MKKIDTEKTYKIKWKNEEAKNNAWVHIHSIGPEIMPNFPSDTTETIKKERDTLRKVIGIIYQCMTLYEDVEKHGWAHGCFLDAFRTQYCAPEMLNYIDWEPMTPEDYIAHGWEPR